MSTLRKTPHLSDGLAAVKYTPASAEEDPEDRFSDTGKLVYMTSTGSAPVNGDVLYQGRATTTMYSSVSPPPPPISSTLNGTYPYYDYNDTDDNESEVGGCDSGDLCSSPSRLPNGTPLLPLNHSTQQQQQYNTHTSTTNASNNPTNHNHMHNNNSSNHIHHPTLSEKTSVDSTTGYNRHHRHDELRDSRDLSKSPLSRRSSRPGGKGRCMCCMMCVFLLSTAGLGAVLALTYAGKVQLMPSAPRHTSHSNGGFKIDRLGDDKVLVQKCETRDCMETAAAILGRMNTSEDPCNDFYNYACGGYNEKTYLSWFNTRIRENPEEIIQHYRRYAIDRLSSSYAKKDSPYLTKARTLFRSCLFKPQTVDERTRAIVAEVIEGLGGLTMPESSNGGKFDLTPLVANVTRMFGASPFFRVLVRGPKQVAIATRASDYQDPLRSSTNVLSRSLDSRTERNVLGSQQTTEELLDSLLARTNYSGDVRLLARDYVRLEANIRRTFNGDSHNDEEDEDESCDEFTRSSFSELQFRHGTYGINWTELVLTVLDLPTTRDVIICHVQLSRPLQHLLEITPQQSLWQFAILHTLLHSDLFIIVPGHKASAVMSHSHSSVRSNIPPMSATKLKTNADEMRVRSPEDQCLDLLEYVMPNLKSSIHCGKQVLESSYKETEFLTEQLRVSLFGILKDLFHISSDNTWKITNSTVNKVKLDALFFLKSLEQNHDSLKLELDEYDFSANILELIKFRNQLYFGGRIYVGTYPAEVTAFGIRACFEDSSLARPGPQLYHATVPHAVRFGSLGTYLASKVADNLGIEDLLDHYSDGVLNHSAVLGLAVRLQCFVEMYNNIKLIDYGTQIYKVNGEDNRVQLWKDQLALQMIMMAWRTYHDAMSDDKALPGLALSRDQLFYVAFAQTQCEKVSERGILQHYVNQDYQMPNKHRVNGPLKNLHDFYRAFHCGSSKDICELF